MRQVTVHTAKTQLSRLIAAAQAGEEDPTGWEGGA